jgi:hypothetical protein
MFFLYDLGLQRLFVALIARSRYLRIKAQMKGQSLPQNFSA